MTMEITLDDAAVRQALTDHVRKEHVAPKNRKTATVEVVRVTRHHHGRASAEVKVTNA